MQVVCCVCSSVPTTLPKPFQNQEGSFYPFCNILANLPATGRCVRKGSNRHSPVEIAMVIQDLAFPGSVGASLLLMLLNVARMWGHASATSAERCSLSSQRMKLLPKYQAVMCSSCALETYPILPSAVRLPSRFLCLCLEGIMHACRGQGFPRALDLWPLYSGVDLCRCAGRARVIWTSLCLLPGLGEPSGR